MPTTNYWDNVNPLSILDVQPTYQKPTQEIMNTLQKRTAYFMQGAQKFKNNYDATEKFGFDLINNNNKKEFEALNNQANAKLKDLSSSDLSISDNVNTAIDLYKPITTNQNFIYDQAVKTTADKTFNAAQSDAAKKNNTSGYNVSLVAYNKEILDMFANDDPNKAKYYLNDKFLGSYWEAPDKVQSDLLKNVEKQFAVTKEQSIQDKDNPYNYFQVKKTVIEKDDVKSFLLENKPEILKNQNEVNARLQLLRAQKTLKPEEVQYQYKQMNDSLIDEKLRVTEARILNEQQRISFVYTTEEEKKNATKYIEAQDGLKKQLLKKKNEDYSVFTDKERLQEAFDKAASIYEEFHTNQLASSIARTVSESSQLKTNQGAYYQDLLKIKREQASKTQTANSDEGRNPLVNVNQTDILASNLTNEQKGKSELEMVKDFSVAGVNKTTLSLIEGFEYMVRDGGTNVNFKDYYANHPNLKLGDLKKLMVDAEDSEGERKYNELLRYVKNAYSDNETTEYKDGKKISSSISSNKAFELLPLNKAVSRLQDMFTDPVRYQHVISYQGNNNFEKQAKLHSEHLLAIQEGNNSIKRASEIVLSTAKESKLLTSEQLEKLSKLPASDLLDADSLASKVFDYSIWEKALNRKLTNDEKSGIYNVVTKPAPTVYYNEFGEAQPYLPANLQGIVRKLGVQNFDTFTRQSGLQFKSFDNLKKLVNEEVGKKMVTPTANSRMFTVTDKAEYNPNEQINVNTLIPLLESAKPVTIGGSTESPELVKATIDIVKTLEPKDYNVTFFEPKGSPDAWATVTLKASALDSKTVQGMDEFEDVKKNNGQIKLRLPISTLKEKNIFARTGGDKDVMDIMENGVKPFLLPNGDNLNISYNKQNPEVASIYTNKEILLPFRQITNDGDVIVNIKSFKIDGTSPTGLGETARMFQFRDANELNTTLKRNPKLVHERVSLANQSAQNVQNLIKQHVPDPSIYMNNERTGISLKKLREGLIKEKGRESADEIISNIKKFLLIDSSQSTTFTTKSLYN